MQVRPLSLALSTLLSSSLLITGAAMPAFAQQVAPATAPVEASPPQPVPSPPNTPPATPAANDDAAPAAQDLPAETDEDARAVSASDDPDASESASTRVPLDEIKRYVGVFNAIREGYVDPVEDRKLMSSAIRGLLLDLDPHSAYLEKDVADAFAENTSGAYVGIGVEVLQLPDGRIKVISPIDETPAAKAGIRAGDTIIAVDGKPLTAADAQGQGPLRGPPGTSARLSILREGEAAPLEIDVTRDTIRVASVRARMLEPGYGYLRVSAFQLDTAEDFRNKLLELQGPTGKALRGLVIDLRSNPGGLLTAAVQIADDLLDKGKIVSTRGRMSINDTEFSAAPGDLMHGAPVVLIVDAGSASASEVLAGALGDNGRARIVGSRTFGKGSVQTVLPLGNGDSVKLTTARYFTPKGTSIQARGIDPDVVLKPDTVAKAGETVAPGPRITEATLPGHLRGDLEDGSGAGDVLDGDGPITAALAELKRPAADVARSPAVDTTQRQ